MFWATATGIRAGEIRLNFEILEFRREKRGNLALKWPIAPL